VLRRGRHGVAIERRVPGGRRPCARLHPRRFNTAFVAAVVLMVFAASFRALVPSGFMPEARTGVFELVICGSDGLRTLLVDAKGEPVDDADDHVERVEVCAFAGAVPAPAPNQRVDTLWRPEWRPAPDEVFSGRLQAPPGQPRAPPSATGPPFPMT